MTDILFTNLALLDPVEGVLRSGHQVLVRDGRFAEAAAGRIDAPGAREFDLGGRTLMPGLIDCHIHICAEGMRAYPTMSPSYVAATAGKILRETLMRGFTTVRDAAGADAGYRRAVEDGLLVGPRLFVAGSAITQTGGHGDGRDTSDYCEPCACGTLRGLGRIADGVPAVRHAVRDELRKGADQIKIMASGGVASPADPIDYVQYAVDEIEAMVDEATRRHTYVMAHAYTADAIYRCVEAGVRTIEHGNMIDEKAARLMAERGAYLVPTLVVYRKIIEHGHEVGVSELHLSKARAVAATGTRSLEIAQRAGVKMAFGTDLFRAPKEYQAEEFLIRAEVLKPADVIRSATIISAEVIRMDGQLGVIAPGALADALVVDGDPFEDLGLLQNQGEHIPAIMKDGVFFKNELDAG